MHPFIIETLSRDRQHQLRADAERHARLRGAPRRQPLRTTWAALLSVAHALLARARSLKPARAGTLAQPDEVRADAAIDLTAVGEATVAIAVPATGGPRLPSARRRRTRPTPRHASRSDAPGPPRVSPSRGDRNAPVPR